MGRPGRALRWAAIQPSSTIQSCMLLSLLDIIRWPLNLIPDVAHQNACIFLRVHTILTNGPQRCQQHPVLQILQVRCIPRPPSPSSTLRSLLRSRVHHRMPLLAPSRHHQQPRPRATATATLTKTRLSMLAQELGNALFVTKNYGESSGR